MKIAYTISGLFNSGGMENILLQKANYLADVLNYEVSIITTDQNDLPIFFKKSEKIRVIDLGINYNDSKNSRLWQIKKLSLLKRHKIRLKEVLQKEQFDIVISLMDFDFSFLYKIKDGSKKIVEFHFQRYYKVARAQNRILAILQYLRTFRWKKIISHYDRFIVLTQEDRKQWGKLENICVIPNFCNKKGDGITSLTSKRVLSIGRADYQKGFDMLVKAWRIVHKSYPDWELAIIGGGDKSELIKQIDDYELDGSIKLYPPTGEIEKEYLNSSLYVLSSRYEGLPLVLLEAISYGMPIVSFTCPCGPSDIVKPAFGSLVPRNDIKELSSAIIFWLANPHQRIDASEAALCESKNYCKENIMKKWDSLFKSLSDD